MARAHAGGTGAQPAGVAERAGLEPLFRYIWKYSRRDQIINLSVVLVSMPFYFVSLDIPKTIVNDAIQGRAFSGGRETALFFHAAVTLPGLGPITLFPGVVLDRLHYLFALSAIFLVLVVINGWFKYFINMHKGKLGERLLRRLRLDLFARLLRFTPEALRTVKPPEIATIIKDEVEPIGAFVGDAFIQPIFLAGQALTALLFIVLQSPLLGIIAAAVVLVQGVMIPRMRREQLRLGRERQIRSRSLAGHIGGIVEAMPEVTDHGTAAFERHQIVGRLDTLFWIRYRLFARKFMVKFVNNMLAQLTPLIFYSLGGFFALRGALDIGQLVAVIGAYRDLPPPVKELIDWDQQRLDVDVKYSQIVEIFAASNLAPGGATDLPPLRDGTIEVQGLKVEGASGELLLDGVSLSIPIGAQVALTGSSIDGASTLAQVIGRRIGAYEGAVTVAGHDLARLTSAAIGSRMAYVGIDAVIFDGSLRDNIVYSLRRPGPTTQPEDFVIRTAVDPAGMDAWLNHDLADADDMAGLDQRIVEVLGIVGLHEDVFRYGLSRKVDTSDDALRTRFVDARHAVRQAAADEGVAHLVETFDPDVFNGNATIGENLLFGVIRGETLPEQALVEHSFTRGVLATEKLDDALVQVGLRIGATMVEIFAGVSRDNILFERFSFIAADDLPVVEDIVGRASGASGLNASDRARLVTLSLRYVEPRHRLGLLSDELRDAIVRARKAFIDTAPADIAAAIEFYDPDRFCAAAPLRDNLLFGRVLYSAPAAAERILEIIRAVLRERALDAVVFRIGLDQQAGLAGRLLFPKQKMALALARALVKRPDILILNQAFGAFADHEARSALARIRTAMAGRTLIFVGGSSDDLDAFDLRFRIEGAKLATRAGQTPAAQTEEEVAVIDHPDLQVLRAVPIFATVDLARLKLISFTSQRLRFAAGEIVFRQDTPSDSAYIVLDGVADVYLETGEAQLQLARIGRNAMIGEMGVITDAPRSATIRAVTDLVAFRLSKELFLSLLAEFPQIALEVMRDQVRRAVVAQTSLAAQQGDVSATKLDIEPATS